jgi:hypothetical protein
VKRQLPKATIGIRTAGLTFSNFSANISPVTAISAVNASDLRSGQSVELLASGTDSRPCR